MRLQRLPAIRALLTPGLRWHAAAFESDLKSVSSRAASGLFSALPSPYLVTYFSFRPRPAQLLNYPDSWLSSVAEASIELQNLNFSLAYKWRNSRRQR